MKRAQRLALGVDERRIRARDEIDAHRKATGWRFTDPDHDADTARIYRRWGFTGHGRVPKPKTPMIKSAPVRGHRPLCLGCGRELHPVYVERLANGLRPYESGDSNDYYAPQTLGWEGGWHGYGRRLQEIPTHCNQSCAARHGSSVAAQLACGPIELSDEGRRRFRHCRPRTEDT